MNKQYKNLLESSQNLGFNEKSECFVKVINGYTVSMAMQDTVVYSIIVDRVLPKEDIKALRKLGMNLYTNQIVDNNNQQIACMCDFIFMENMIIKTIKSPKQVNKNLEKLDAITKLFSEKGYQEVARCIICGNEIDPMIDQNPFYGRLVPMHSGCKAELKEATKQEIENTSGDNKKYPLSLILTLVGCIVGIIPTILSILFTESIFSLLYALIPLAGLVGYKLGKGPRDEKMTITIVVCSVIATLLLELGFAYYLAEASGYPLVDVIMEVTLPGLPQTLLFVGLGIWISWRAISNTSSKKKENTNRM